MKRADRARAGFTLLEVIVALTVGAVVLLGARAMLVHLGDDSERLTTFVRETDGPANADRLLRTLVGSLEVGTDSATHFAGEQWEARFTSWCSVPAGWQERCTVTLAIDTVLGRRALVARTSTGPPVVLRRGFREGALRYLSDADAGGTWFRVWGTGVTSPLAIGVILDADTLILRVGERG
ncbi:MAG: PulJ/GspJ family protein [Gemmatimonadaceae bacterium]